MNTQQLAAAQFKKAEVLPHHVAQGPEFQRLEIQRLRERCRTMQHKLELMQASLDYYQDKADTLEKICVDNGLMTKTKHLDIA